jgi:hypothetical protein
MNRQQQIDDFLLSAHKLALSRLRAEPHRLLDVKALLSRWRAQSGPTRSDIYRDEWDVIVDAGVDAIERVAGGQGDHAAALRNVSPLSILISQRERAALLRQARQAA